MPARFRRYLPHLTVALFAALLATPLARGMGTCTDDGALHITRAVEIEQLLRAGHLFPRWAPDLAHGFGYPLFNYYAPLSAYVVVAFHLLGFNFGIALHLTYFVALLGAGLATYSLGRDLWGSPLAGLVAAVGYISAPYLAFDLLFRGALAETFAWLWPPLILWAMLRALAGHGRRVTVGSWRLAALAYAGLTLTHNNLALLASPLLAAFAALLAWERRSLRTLAHGALILLAGLALSAYFWLPALAETKLVRTDRLLVPPIFTYYTNWLTPRELLAPPLADDPRLLNPSPAKALGLVPALAALPAVAGLARRSARGRWRRVAFFAVALAVYALLTLPVTKPIWDHLPLLPLTQFPWRTLSLAALCAALLAGAALADARSTPDVSRSTLRVSRSTLIAAALCAGLLLANLPWWYPRYCSRLQDAGVADIARYEYDSATIGTSARGEFMPVTVPQFPPDNSLGQAIIAGQFPDRVDPASLPPGAGYSYLKRDPLDTRFTLSAAQPFTLTYRNFYFPGWRVRVDGQPAVIKVTSDYGLISFDVPAGEHEVRVSFELTPLRLAASVVSLMAAFGLAWGALAAPRPGRGGPRAGRPHGVAPAVHPAFVLLPVALLGLKLGWLDRAPNPLRHTRFDGEQVAGVTHPLRADFVGGVSLFGYDFSRAVVPSGEALDVSVYVGVRQHVEVRYWPTFSLQDAQGLTWSLADQDVPRWHREPPYSPLWPPLPQSYAQWSRQLRVLPGTPPGRYQVWLTVFDLDTKAPASVLDEAGNPIAPRLPLGEVEVARPVALDPQAFPDAGLPGIRLGPALTLLGFSVDREAARPGDTLLITLFWRAEAPPTGEKVTLRLGEAAWTVDPVPGFPAERWQAGDVWRGQMRLTLPATLPGGEYRFGVQIEGAGEPGMLSPLRVEAPPHRWAQPPVGVRVNARVGEFAELVGYTLEGSTVTLVWRALATPSTSYAAFVHLSDGAVNRAQSDSIPANYDRPTTGWLPGEYIVDPHPLALPPDLPPGEYRLFAGLYDPQTGARLATGAPDHRVPLGVFSSPPP